jgi:hypothetical protein
MNNSSKFCADELSKLAFIDAATALEIGKAYALYQAVETPIALGMSALGHKIPGMAKVTEKARKAGVQSGMSGKKLSKLKGFLSHMAVPFGVGSPFRRAYVKGHGIGSEMRTTGELFPRKYYK